MYPNESCWAHAIHLKSITRNLRCMNNSKGNIEYPFKRIFRNYFKTCDELELLYKSFFSRVSNSPKLDAGKVHWSRSFKYVCRKHFYLVVDEIVLNVIKFRWVCHRKRIFETSKSNSFDLWSPRKSCSAMIQFRFSFTKGDICVTYGGVTNFFFLSPWFCDSQFL